jgi:hypothetical protein
LYATLKNVFFLFLLLWGLLLFFVRRNGLQQKQQLWKAMAVVRIFFLCFGLSFFFCSSLPVFSFYFFYFF